MRVERYDYSAQFEGELDDILAVMREILVSGRYGSGDETAAFEREFADFIGARHVCAVNTGTDALIIALQALGIGPGHEVVTQANTFNATVAAIALVGATPVLVDAHESSFLLDDSQLEAAVTARTRAVIPVHLYGKATAMDTIAQLCEDRKLDIVEDAAQAHGARIDGRCVGTFGIAGCFSFHPSKNLASAGDGGAVVTSDDRLERELRRRRALGQRAQNDHVVLGLNTKLHALQAVVLSAKLPRLRDWNARRAALAKAYRTSLEGLPLGFQAPGGDGEHVYHLFVVTTPLRDALLGHLRRAGIDVVVRYPVPIHLQPAFSAYGWQRGQFPVAERLAAETLCLPLRPDMSASEVAFTSDAVRRFFAGVKS